MVGVGVCPARSRKPPRPNLRRILWRPTPRAENSALCPSLLLGWRGSEAKMRSIFAEESATYEDKEQVRKRRVVAPEHASDVALAKT